MKKSKGKSLRQRIQQAVRGAAWVLIVSAAAGLVPLTAWAESPSERESHAAPYGTDEQPPGQETPSHGANRGGPPGEDNPADACERLRVLEQDMKALKGRLSVLGMEISRHRKTIQEAEDRLIRLPGYVETVRMQQKVNRLLEMSREEGIPSRRLSSALIDVSLKLEGIMREDPEVAAAMDAIKSLSLEKRSIESGIQQKETEAEALRSGAGDRPPSPSSPHTPPAHVE